jgi:hypothetical protein
MNYIMMPFLANHSSPLKQLVLIGACSLFIQNAVILFRQILHQCAIFGSN